MRPKPAAALRHLAGLGILDPSHILDGLPHPSGANAERVAYFLGRKAMRVLGIAPPRGPALEPGTEGGRAKVKRKTEG